jgi:hypothetical protein
MQERKINHKHQVFEQFVKRLRKEKKVTEWPKNFTLTKKIEFYNNLIDYFAGVGDYEICEFLDLQKIELVEDDNK